MDPVSWIAIGVGAGALILLRRWKPAALRRREALRAGPTTRIADVRTGQLVKVIGRIVSLEAPVVAPLSGRACVYSESLAEKKHERPAWQNEPLAYAPWHPIARDVRTARCEIDDGSGRLAIDPAVATQRLLGVHYHATSGPENPPDATQVRFLEGNGQRDDDWVIRPQLRYIERLLLPGDEVTIIGRAELRDGSVHLEPGPDLVLEDCGLRSGTVSGDPPGW